MSRVPWERYNGDDVESVVAIMILRENPSGQRIRPSRGDGGVDILIPISRNVWEVYQVKRFTKPLDGTQKGHIRNSWDRLMKFTEERDIQVAKWHVVRPLDPTHEDRAWLDDLTGGSGIPSDWIGLSTIDGWAAKYVDVVDYYLRDSKERVLEQARHLLAADSLRKAGEVTPAESLDGLESIYLALNATDPHYRYEFHVTTTLAEGASIIESSKPGLLYSTQRWTEGGPVVRIDVFARYSEATIDRPLVANVLLLPESDDQKSALRGLRDYGRGISRIPARVEAVFPGGFSISNTSKTEVSVLPRGMVTKRMFELVVTEEDGTELSRLPIELSAPSTGLVGNGLSLEGKGADGIFAFCIEYNPDIPSARLETRVGDLTGYRPADVVRVLETLLAITKGSVRIVLSLRDGPEMAWFEGIREDPDAVADIESRLLYVKPLAELQRHIPAQITVPDQHDVTAEDFQGWHDAMALLRGESLKYGWESLNMVVASTGTIYLPATVRITRHLEVRIGSGRYVLGQIDQTVVAERWQPEDGEPENSKGLLLPGERHGNVLTASLATDLNAKERADQGVVQFAPFDGQSDIRVGNQ